MEIQNETWLIRHPVSASIILVGLYLLFILLAPNIAVLEGPPGEVGYAFFIIGSATQALLWLVVVPRFLGLPDGKQPLKEYLRKIRLLQYSPAKRNLLLTVLCMIIILISGFVFSVLTGYYVFDLAQVLPPQSTSLFVGFVPGIWEEIAWRGVILTLFLKKYGEKESMAISSFLFSAPHLLNLLGVAVTADMILMAMAQLVYAFLLGLVFAYLVLRTGSLLPSIIIHYFIVAIGPLFIFTPGADPLIKSIMLMLGAGIIPAILCILLIHTFHRYKL
ncbi:MAG: lysostaphin resistance A-like protein, partial [Candidatus Thorarchaeota archaeon]